MTTGRINQVNIDYFLFFPTHSILHEKTLHDADILQYFFTEFKEIGTSKKTMPTASSPQ